MAQTEGKTVRVRDTAALKQARDALKQLLGVDASDAVVVDAGLGALIEKLAGQSLPAERVRPLILRCQVAALQRFASDLIDLGYPLDSVIISLDERSGGIIIEHGDDAKITYEADGIAGLNLIN